MLQTARQVGIGDEDAAERDGVGMTIGNRGLRCFPGESAGEIRTPRQTGRNSTIAEGTF